MEHIYQKADRVSVSLETNLMRRLLAGQVAIETLLVTKTALNVNRMMQVLVQIVITLIKREIRVRNESSFSSETFEM